MKEVIGMLKVGIYYRQKEYENVEKSVKTVKEILGQLEKTHRIIGVFLDSFNDRTELNELLNFPLNELDILYVNHSFDDEFDTELLIQLSKAEKFVVRYIEELENY
jgi:hypothetical protein